VPSARMYGLLKRLDKIQRDCADGKDAHAEEVDPNLDEFGRLKKKIATDMRQIRILIKERDEMEKVAPGTVGTVELSHNIRAKLKDIRSDALGLEKLQKDEKTTHLQKKQDRHGA